MKKLICLFLIVLSITVLVGCGDEATDGNEENPGSETVGDATNTDIVLNDLIVNYNGEIHSIEVENLPEGYSVAYIGNDVTSVGQYKVMAFISNEKGELILTLEATIIIKEADNTEPETNPEDVFSNIVFNSLTIVSDGNSHSINISNLPEGYTVTYIGNGVTEVGHHVVKAEIYNSDNECVYTISSFIHILAKSAVELPLV